MTRRMEKATEAKALRGQGLKLREIADRMGVAVSTVDAWLNDPDGSRLKARKDSYRGVCEECGARTDGSVGPGLAPTRCISCIRWTDEEIVAAIKRWAAKHGEPPRCNEWDSSGPDHPSSNCLTRRKGWDAYLKLAGFEPRYDRTPERHERIVGMVRSGIPCCLI